MNCSLLSYRSSHQKLYRNIQQNLCQSLQYPFILTMRKYGNINSYSRVIGWKLQASYSERALHDRWECDRLLKILSSSLFDMSEDDPYLDLELDFGLFL